MPSPIAHSLMGLGLYNENAPVRRRRWMLLALLVFVSNAPDLDFLPGLEKGDAFLFHRLITHSLFFSGLCAAAVYAVLAALRRPHARRLAILTLMALLSHIAMDYFCGTAEDGVALFWPMSAERFASHLRLFPALLRYPVFGLANLWTVLTEISIMMIVLQASAFHRFLRALWWHPRVARRAAASAPSGAGAEAP